MIDAALAERERALKLVREWLIRWDKGEVVFDENDLTELVLAGGAVCANEARAEADKQIEIWTNAYFQDEGITPEGELRPLVSKLVARAERAANEARLEEAERMYANWNVDESIRRFDVWARNHIAELRRALKAEG